MDTFIHSCKHTYKNNHFPFTFLCLHDLNMSSPTQHLFIYQISHSSFLRGSTSWNHLSLFLSTSSFDLPFPQFNSSWISSCVFTHYPLCERRKRSEKKGFRYGGCRLFPIHYQNLVDTRGNTAKQIAFTCISYDFSIL